MIKSISGTINRVKNFLSNTSGNVAVMFALLSIPLFAAGGAALDYTRVIAERSKVQESMDAALLAGVSEAQAQIAKGRSTTDAMEYGKKVAKDYYAVALIDRKVRPNGVFDPVLQVNGPVIEGSATVAGTVDTSLMAVVGIEKAAYSANSTAKISAPTFVELHFVVDNSNSMGIGASQQDVTTMKNSSMSCAFACHAPADHTPTPGVIYDTLSDARALGVELRIDVVRNAMQQVITNLGSKALGIQLKTAIYTASNTLVEEQEVTENLQLAVDSVNDITLANDWLTGGTSMDHVIDTLESKIGTSGDGYSQGEAKKIVVIITDGIQTNFRYDRSHPDQHDADPNFEVFQPTVSGNGRTAQSIQGFDPQMCETLKTRNNVDIYTVNLEYVIPDNATDQKFIKIRDELKSDIEDNLMACATEESNFFKANDPDEIYEAFDELAEQVLKDDLILAQ